MMCAYQDQRGVLIQFLNKYYQPVCAIITSQHQRLMNTSYSHKKTISITLNLEVYDDFDYNQIDFNSLLELEGNETVDVSITDHSRLEVF